MLRWRGLLQLLWEVQSLLVTIEQLHGGEEEEKKETKSSESCVQLRGGE